MEDIFGNPLSAGFVEPLAWRADMAANCASLLKESPLLVESKQKLKNLDDLELDEWVDVYTHPLILALLCEINAEDFNKEIILGVLSDTIEAIDTFDNCCVPIPNTRMQLVSSHPNTEVILKAVKIKGKGSRRDDCLDADLLLCDDDEFLNYQQKIVSALALIKKYSVGFYNDVTSFIRYITLVKNASFRGSSSTYHYGMVYFCPEPSWSELDWAEELIHEASHQLLECIVFNNKLFDNDELAAEPQFRAPIRQDLRPAYGVYHALFVVARIKQFYSILEEQGQIDRRSKQYIEKLTQRSVALIRPMSELKFITNTGREMIKGYIEPILISKT